VLGLAQLLPDGRNRGFERGELALQGQHGTVGRYARLVLPGRNGELILFDSDELIEFVELLAISGNGNARIDDVAGQRHVHTESLRALHIHLRTERLDAAPLPAKKIECIADRC
jgi:hypothetical protein